MRLDVVKILCIRKCQMKVMTPVPMSIVKTGTITCGVGCNQLNAAIHNIHVALDRVKISIPSSVAVSEEILQ